jgi:hypothetical protein
LIVLSMSFCLIIVLALNYECFFKHIISVKVNFADFS